MKSKEDKLDVHKLEPVPVDFSKLSGVVKNEVVEKTEYNKSVKKVNTIKATDTSNLVKKTNYDTDVSKIEKKLLVMIIVISILLHENLIS